MSKLYRATAGIPRPLFQILMDGHTWSDPHLTSLTITHGKSNPSGGLYPATAEINVSGAVGILHDRDIRVQLSPAAALALTGSAAAQPRFTGRVATQEVTTHARRGRGPYHTSVLRCSSWSSLYLAAGGATTLNAGTNLNVMLERLFDRVARRVGKSIGLKFRGEWFDTTYAAVFDQEFAQLLQDYYTEPGYLLRQRRDGDLEPMTLAYRGQAGESAAGSWWPITLGNSLGGVRHEQTTDVSAIGIRLTWRQPNAEGTGTETLTRPWAWLGSRSGVSADTVLEWRDYDWSHITWNTEQYRHGINALSLQAFRVAYTTPTITVDLLALIRRDDNYSRTMLRQLLQLEQGDPVVFGADWSGWWNGIYYAEKITETITPTSWTLELSLYPPQEVTGWYGTSPGPMPPARIWSQAPRPWTTGTEPWS